ncbi:hypothetical protein [Craterilacuibacter sp. RT1T]|nr:hypothetical protein [Craterilacuibacter sp. RT1T]
MEVEVEVEVEVEGWSGSMSYSLLMIKYYEINKFDLIVFLNWSHFFQR